MKYLWAYLMLKSIAIMLNLYFGQNVILIYSSISNKLANHGYKRFTLLFFLLLLHKKYFLLPKIITTTTPTKTHQKIKFFEFYF